MRELEYIEQQIQELTAGEFKEQREWIIDRDWKAWDAHIEGDANGGKLDKPIADAQGDYVSDRAREL